MHDHGSGNGHMTVIHPSAVVDPGAMVGADVEIGPYCVIGPHVAIGDRTRLMSHVVLDGWTTLGAECRVFPFASIGTQTQDLKYAGGRSFVEIAEHTARVRHRELGDSRRGGHAHRRQLPHHGLLSCGACLSGGQRSHHVERRHAGTE